MSDGNSTIDSRIYSQIHGEKCWPTVDKVSPCEEACPIHMDVPSYVVAISLGKFEEALKVARLTNPFPYICGTICHHPCEDVCSRALVDKPIAIRDIKRFVGAYQEKNGAAVEAIERTKAEKIAIIGSGPAGLTAAHDLIRAGYGVSVFEALPVAGGMFAAGIPDFILPKKAVELEVDYIRSLGVDIKTNMRIGKNLSMDDLRNQGYGAILIASGAWKNAELPISGTDLKGVRQALPFLRDVKIDEKIRMKGTVCVIGGGNTALDAARTAIRLGAKKVVVSCLESREEMPSHEWEIEVAEKEGIEFQTRVAPQEFIGRPGGNVRKIAFKKVSSFNRDDEGAISWTLDEGADSEFTMDVNSVLIAIGQRVDSSFVQQAELTGNGTFQVDPATLATNVPGLFAAGDAVRNPGTAVDAIAAGHKVARSIDSFLQGGTMEQPSKKAGKETIQLEEDAIPLFLAKKSRWDMPTVSPKDAVRSFGEAELGYTEWQVIEEAKRCLNCRMCGNCVFGRAQICFETGNRLIASQ
ncbi:MAG: FAD-dependent oxidoreductase [Proteobacteria bacterium]|nr:FAD-dependent oxidoreductase [Pseudomonadota bacterium]